MERKVIQVTVNGTEFVLETELTYDDTSHVPFIPQQQAGSWNYESKIRGRQGRK